MKPIPDRDARRQALDPEGSFIVQAPAGSGKTELLTQRFLRLLGSVMQPEEIVAITFTRKAAAEMRNRVLSALDDAQGPCPAEAHRAETWSLAREALQRDQQRQWQLRLNPSRLRIQTFDSLSASLARQLPLLSEMGAPPRTREDASALHREAAQATLMRLEETHLAQPLTTLLRHLDNRLAQLADLLVQMLGKRDQWLPHLHATGNIDFLEQALGNLIAQHLAGLDRGFSAALMGELIKLARFAAEHLPADKRSQAGLATLAAWQERRFRPGTAWTDLGLWQGLAKLLLTDKGEPRRRVDKNLGFPPGEKEAKDQLISLIEYLHAEPILMSRLHATRGLPLRSFDARQAELLEALRAVLMDATAQLDLVFQEHAELDFIEVQLRAQRALGTSEQPGELAMLLDYRIRHLLVDEFQDTSIGQYRLLEGLTAGWQPDDGRTLFVVGDPMQSIYRFRKAEVGLFLRANQEGMRDVPLDALRLEMNFRSQAGVVDWVNHCFSRLFPDEVDLTLGAMPYAASVARHASLEGNAVQVHGFAERDDIAEAGQVVQLVREAIRNLPEGSIAVLARARSHLHAIANALQQADIPYQAVKVDPLASRPTVQDLHSLTQALLHPADRLAWLSLLRSPLVGMASEDLVRLCAGETRRTLWALLGDERRVDSLDVDGQQRLRRARAILQPQLPGRGRRSLRDWVESVWLSLGGALVGDIADAHAYLELLEAREERGTIADFAQLEEALAQLFAPPASQVDGRLQLMTMHQAKGLEFDTVILPGLGRRPPNESHELLYWLELPDPHEEAALLMAPIKGAYQDDEPISAYIRVINRGKQEHEDLRLLYVAATRARQRLHLLGHVRFAADGDCKPEKNSLLARLWPVLHNELGQLDPPSATGTEPAWTLAPRLEQRIPGDWQPDLPSPAGASPEAARERAAAAATIDFGWSGDTARHVGTVTHRYLERIALEGLSRWPLQDIDMQRDTIMAALATLGVDPTQQESACERILQALRLTLQDERGRWILASHAEAACELALTILDDAGQPCQYVIDRTFIADGVRWIIDYKTSEPGELALQTFLDQEQAHYQPQLENYARILRLLEDRPTRLALYFPLAQAWCDWEAAEPPEGAPPG